MPFSVRRVSYHSMFLETVYIAAAAENTFLTTKSGGGTYRSIEQ